MVDVLDGKASGLGAVGYKSTQLSWGCPDKKSAPFSTRILEGGSTIAPSAVIGRRRTSKVDGDDLVSLANLFSHADEVVIFESQ